MDKNHSLRVRCARINEILRSIDMPPISLESSDIELRAFDKINRNLLTNERPVDDVKYEYVNLEMGFMRWSKNSCYLDSLLFALLYQDNPFTNFYRDETNSSESKFLFCFQALQYAIRNNVDPDILTQGRNWIRKFLYRSSARGIKDKSRRRQLRDIWSRQAQSLPDVLVVLQRAFGRSDPFHHVMVHDHLTCHDVKSSFIINIPTAHRWTQSNPVDGKVNNRMILSSHRKHFPDMCHERGQTSTELYAIIVHRPSIQKDSSIGGHYVCYFKHAENSSWFLYDDQLAGFVNVGDWQALLSFHHGEVTLNADILFYRPIS